MAKATKSKKLITISVLAYFVFLLFMLPANILYQIVKPQNLPVEVVAVSGTLWDGTIVIKHRYTSQVSVDWQLSPWGLLLGQINARLDVQSDPLKGSASMSLGLITKQLQLDNTHAYVQAALINRFAKAQRVTVQGDVELSNVNLVFDASNHQTQSAQGALVWLGGDVSYPVARKQQTARLPMLVAKLAANDGQLMLDVKTDEGLMVAKGSLKTDGWASIAVLRRMLDIIGQPWNNKVAADSTVFELSEKVFNK